MKHHDDGQRPSLERISERMELGDYGPEVEPTIRALLEVIDELEQGALSAETQLDHLLHGRLHD